MKRLTHRRPSSNRADGVRRGFTLIELLVGAAIMTVALAMIYQIFHWISSSAGTEIWASDTTKKLTNADTRLREYLSRAGYPTALTPQGMKSPSDADKLASCRVVVSSGSTSTETDGDKKWRVFEAAGNEGSPGTVLMGFYRVDPGTLGVEGKPNKPVAAQYIRLFFSRGHRVAESRAPLADLVMDETRCTAYDAYTSLAALGSLVSLPAPDKPAAARPYVMATDVSKVKISARTEFMDNTTKIPQPTELDTSYSSPPATVVSPRDDPSVLRIEIDCLDNQRGRRHVFKRIEGETHVGVNMAGSP